MVHLTTKGWILFILLLIAGVVTLSRYTEFNPQRVKKAWAKLTQWSVKGRRSEPSDAEIRAAILEALLKDPTLRNFPLEMTVSQGTVTVTGIVATSGDRAAVERLVKATPGVRAVILNLAVSQPVRPPRTPTKDDPDARLAKEVEFSLYRTEAFNLTTIKVTSREGIIRLRGTVRNTAEKLLAERIAREVEGVKEVVNDLEVAK